MLSDLWDEYSELVYMVATIAVLLALVLSCVGGFSYFSNKAECNGYHENTGVETKYVHNGILSWECFVKVNDDWIPADKWRGVN